MESEWNQLCEFYLPILPTESIWRFSRNPSPQDPEQGWKLHLSATILSASKLLQKVGPFLGSNGVMFKGPKSIEQLAYLNSGLRYGFSQVGKFITVYPKDVGEAIRLARKLSALTRGLPAPAVPYDIEFSRGGCVYYRYGVFGSTHIKLGSKRVSALRKPDGSLTPDRREPGFAIPSWLSDPFKNNFSRRAAYHSPLMTSFRAYEAMSQRGKGGVYRALDLTVAPARLCVLKEGRQHGETDISGRDGRWRITYEHGVLSTLRRSGLNVARIYDSFELEGHYYLVTEFINGRNLQEIVRNGELSTGGALEYARQVAQIVARIHAAGWVWRDCKPLNLIAWRRGRLRPVDFEGACPISKLDPIPWGTPGYVCPRPGSSPIESHLPEDLYALGATLYNLFSGRPPGTKRIPRLSGDVWRRVPRKAKEVTTALLDADWRMRPSAKLTSNVLRELV